MLLTVWINKQNWELSTNILCLFSFTLAIHILHLVQGETWSVSLWKLARSLRQLESRCLRKLTSPTFHLGSPHGHTAHCFPHIVAWTESRIPQGVANERPRWRCLQQLDLGPSWLHYNLYLGCTSGREPTHLNSFILTSQRMSTFHFPKKLACRRRRKLLTVLSRSDLDVGFPGAAGPSDRDRHRVVVDPKPRAKAQTYPSQGSLRRWVDRIGILWSNISFYFFLFFFLYPRDSYVDQEPKKKRKEKRSPTNFFPWYDFHLEGLPC